MTPKDNEGDDTLPPDYGKATFGDALRRIKNLIVDQMVDDRLKRESDDKQEGPKGQ